MVDKNIETLKAMRDELCKQVDAISYAIQRLERKQTKSKNAVKHTSIDIEETKKQETNIQPTLFADPPQPKCGNYFEGGPGGICM